MKRRERKELNKYRVPNDILAQLESDLLTPGERFSIALEAWIEYDNNVDNPRTKIDIHAAIEKAKEKRLDVKKAIKHPGAFHEWCVEHGYEKVTPECIEEGLKDPDPVVRRRARFAKVLLELQKRRQEKLKQKKNNTAGNRTGSKRGRR